MPQKGRKKREKNRMTLRKLRAKCSQHVDQLQDIYKAKENSHSQEVNQSQKVGHLQKKIKSQELNYSLETVNSQQMNQSKKVIKSLEVNKSQEVNQSQKVNRSVGVNKSQEVNQSQKVNRSVGVNKSQEVNQSQKVNQSVGVNKSQEVNQSQKVNQSVGVNKSQEVIQSEKVNKSLEVNKALEIIKSEEASQSQGSLFRPISTEWRKQKCESLLKLKPIAVLCNKDTTVNSIPLSAPINLKHTIGDGNCYFRAVSYVLTGTEDFHLDIRRHVVQHMLSNPNLFSRLIGGSVDSHILCNRIDLPFQWATEIEIFATAHMLKTDIFVYSKYGEQWKWLRHSVRFVDPHSSSDEMGIYLQHTGGSHFDVVLSVTHDFSNRLEGYFRDQLNKASKQVTENFNQSVKYNKKRMINITKKRSSSTLENSSSSRKKQTVTSTESVKESKMIKCLKEQHRYKTDLTFRNKKISASKEKYSTDKEFRLKKISDSKRKHQSDPNLRAKKVRKSQQRYQEDKQYSDKKIISSKLKYKTDFNYKDNKKNIANLKYKTDLSFKEKRKNADKSRYSCDDKYKQLKKMASVSKYAADVKHRDTVKQYSKNRYAQNAEHRNSVKNVSVNKYAKNIDHRNSVKAASMNKYAKNIDHRNSVKAASMNKYAKNIDHRNSVRNASVNKYAKNVQHRNSVKRLSSSKYKEDQDFKSRKKINSRTKYCLKKESLKSVENVIVQFRQMVQYGPSFICTVCIRKCFRSQVMHCSVNNYSKTPETKKLSEKCITGMYKHDCDKYSCQNPSTRCQEWICYTCHRHLLKGNLPPQAYVNGLQLHDVPDCIKNLNSLERQLISLRIPFLQLLKLPRGNQRGVRGPVTSVPNDIHKVTSVLPRTINNADVILVKFKRRLSDKGHYQYQYVNPTDVEASVKYLIENNYWYSAVNFDSSWMSEEFEPTDDNNGNIYDSAENIHSESILLKDNCKETVVPLTSDDIDKESPNMKDSHSSEDISKELMSDDKESKDILPADGELYTDTSLQPDDIGQDFMDQLGEKIFCVAPAEGNRPENIFMQKGTEAMAFPCQFPLGKNTLNESSREVKLTPSKYFNARLFCADNRFSSDSLYIFFAQYFCELHFVLSNISIAIRKGKEKLDTGEKVTAKMLSDSKGLKNILTKDLGFRFLQPVRGTPPYWEKTLKDLFAIIRQLGIPTWFATFSSADLRWTELHQIILDQKDDSRKVDQLDYSDKCELLRDDPITAARMFDHRVNILLRQVIQSPAQPIGKITDFFIRTEFQQRGSPHIHCMFWVEGAPKFNEDSDKDVCDFIDSYISCQLPNKDTDPELYTIISEVQMHSKNHSKSCKKQGKECRFHFPRPPMTSTQILRNKTADQSDQQSEHSKDLPEHSNNETSVKNIKDKLKEVWQTINSLDDDTDICLSDILSLVNMTEKDYIEALEDLNKRDTVMLKRSTRDIWVNNYNQHLIRAWNANMDLQFVLDPYSCVVYILSYISKAEREMGEILKDANKEAKQGNQDVVKQMRTLGSVYLHNREISCQEAVYRVCGLNLKQCSRTIVFIPCGSDTVKMSKPIQQIKAALHSDDDSDDIWMNSIHDKYRNRPLAESFENMCLATFVSLYRTSPSTQVPLSQSLREKRGIFQLQNDLGFIQKRTGKTPVIRYPRFRQTKRPEQFYMSQLQLYLPHRCDSDIKPPNFDSYEQFIKYGKIHGRDTVLNIVESNRSVYETDVEKLENAWDHLQENNVQEDAWAILAAEAEADRLQDSEQRTAAKVSEMPEIPELGDKNSVPSKDKSSTQALSKAKFTEKTISPLLQTLNNKQKDVFYSLREWCLQKVWNKQPPPFHLYVTGGAGTGKSHLIKCIYYEANRILRPLQENPDDLTVLLTAPTGTAAFNICGSTIHSAFNIGINPKLPYRPLSENRMNTLRSKLGNIQILIIDEISMVDTKLLAYIHGRLSQIKQTSSRTSFGNTSVLAVGDFFQIPPVKGTPLYKSVIGDFSNLWFSNFSCVTLTEIMRQKNDLLFAELLNRLRTKPKSVPLDSGDLASLQSRFMDENSPDYPKRALHIFPTNRECEAHNQDMLSEIGKTKRIFEIPALDLKKDAASRETLMVNKPSSSSSSILPAVLYLAVGARIILTHNVDTEEGLANGAFGTVTDIVQSKTISRVTSVFINFDNPAIGRNTQNSNKSVKILRFEQNSDDRKKIRLQFPLKLGWASTIHKVQGSTSQIAVVSLKHIFHAGMAYVALSRVTALSGLNIINFDESVIYASDLVKDAIVNMPEFMPSVKWSTPSDGFILAHHNTEGLMQNYKNIISSGILAGLSVFCITETWISGPTHPNKQLLPGFQLHHKSRFQAYNAYAEIPLCNLHLQDRGGVGICVKTTVSHKLLSLKTMNMEYIAVQISSPNILICCIYRPPSLEKAIFCLQLNNLLEEISLKKSDTYIVLGDFNENYFHPGVVCDLFQRHKYRQLIEKPTTMAQTALDLIFIKGQATDKQAQVRPIFYSYHDPVYISF